MRTVYRIDKTVFVIFVVVIVTDIIAGVVFVVAVVIVIVDVVAVVVDVVAVVVVIVDVVAVVVDVVVVVVVVVIVVVVAVAVVVVDVVFVVVVVVVIDITHIIGITSDGFLSLLGVIHTYMLQRGPDNNNNNKFVLYNCGRINQATTSYKGLEQFCVQLCSCGFLGC